MRRLAIIFIISSICTLKLHSQSLSNYSSSNLGPLYSALTPLSEYSFINNSSTLPSESLYTAISYRSFSGVRTTNPYHIANALIARGFKNQGIAFAIHSQGFNKSKINSINLSYNKRLGLKSGVALTYEFLQFSATNETSLHAGSVNFSSFYSPLVNLSFGLVIENLLPHFDVISSSLDFAVGASYALEDNVIIHFALEKQGMQTNYEGSIEYRIEDFLLFNLGIRIPDPSIGLGCIIALKKNIDLQLSSAYQPSFGVPLSLGFSYHLEKKPLSE